MNFYKHHIGDYDADTSHLSMLEDAAYSRLMRAYYRTERAIPADLKAACRLVRANTKHEKDAVSVVLNEFFTLEADGWHNKRCDYEIAEFHRGDEDREQKEANESERVRRHRERRKALFETLRARGIVPKWDTKTQELERLCNAPVTRTGAEPERPDNAPFTAYQNPESRIQNQENPKALTPVEIPTSPAVEIAVALRCAGVDVNAAHPTVQGWAERGINLQTVRQAIQIATVDRGKIRPPINYLAPIIDELSTPKPMSKTAEKIALLEGMKT